MMTKELWDFQDIRTWQQFIIDEMLRPLIFQWNMFIFPS
jgi:hypothetical protein